MRDLLLLIAIWVRYTTSVWKNKPIQDSHFLTCSECVARYRREEVRFERINFSVEIQ